MHLLVRETATLDDQEAAVDLGQSAADVVMLSFSDSDLGGMAQAWQAMGGGRPHERPSLRLANLVRLRHPLSVDLYVEQVIARARCVVIRILGGVDYWAYGCAEVARVCRAAGIALIMIEGDGRVDARLAAMSTIGGAMRARMAGFLREGGTANMAAALGLAAHLAGLGEDAGVMPVALPAAGVCGVPAAARGRPVAVVVVYRSHVLAGDTAPVEALAAALAARGMAVEVWFVASLKDAAAADFIAARLAVVRPAIVLNATGFAARAGAGFVLDLADVPVLQVILSASFDAGGAGFRGVSQTDLAMQVALPELDGRLLTTAISFKAAVEEVAGLEFARVINRPDPAGVALAADRAAGWVRLARAGVAERRVAVVISDYPGVDGAGSGEVGSGEIGHAVGLDCFASLAAMIEDMAGAGYACGAPVDAAALVLGLCHDAPGAVLAVADYRQYFRDLPAALRDAMLAAWGEPEADAAVVAGVFRLRHVRCGQVVVAVQPDRGSLTDRKAGYHDAGLPPCHAYVAFYIWLRRELGVHALVHLGTHGTVEWLPGKAAALGEACWPVALLRGLPVIYPFIVNNPGEAAAAKRRLGAVTIGHLTPPLVAAGSGSAALERLIDEYAAADGMDRRRAALLRRQIIEQAADGGWLAECGVPAGADEDVALARLDAYLCDVKDLQIRDGLHVFGRAPRGRAAMLAALTAACPGVDDLAARLDGSGGGERAALLAALEGRFVAPGPAGAPSRGRADVLPTGRNLTTLDPRMIPTGSAMALAAKAAGVLLARHRQDQGDDLRAAVIDLWGSASLRTGGEDLALAMILLGVAPVWDAGTGRVGGFEIVPLAVLDRPRVDVTLRISGLFRDAFEAQILLFDAAVRAVAARDEAVAWNPLAAARDLTGEAFRAATARIYGAAPGDYGSGVADRLARGGFRDRDELGRAYLAASSSAYGQGLDGAADAAGFAALVRKAGAFVHQQDHAETDILDSPEYAAHEGGFAAAAVMLGGEAALYHMDVSRPDAPRSRLVAEEVARVVRGRLANPRWIAGMMRHGYRGGAEMARGVAALHGFAATMPARFDAQFDLVFDAMLGDAAVDGFLRRENPAARAAIIARLADARGQDLWHPHRNDVAAALEAGA
ncbi:MAG: cobaltochelatase subunit CobN [Acidiphilium sp. 37-64-53]|uniref:cobaltochelatase subunit CobN n=2 Tax=Acidocellaceae TaxID=3385905 RepID=UPI000BD59BB6|nr:MULTISPECIES: cobaltochelatase subunit CobN [Acidiphilium]OYW03651.1 MAG: cobaltochelatase subunit CobN [Acidiphilium sp. 37-64-53]OZB29746.1 MAG: cobaltochelatase subunit CobN [Acidiphilium sp. 34-64-41]HQT84250.1 cobaltochelatase subunit CobN [Acidiphilium rubrum]